MRIFYIHQYFKTPDQGGAVRSYYLAKGLVEAGHDVEMITGGDTDQYEQTLIDGIKVHYLPVPYQQEFGFIRRVASFLNFVKLAKRLIKKLSPADILYVSSTPLTTGMIGLWAQKKKGIPYIFEVRDLWPKAPIEVGAIRNPLLKRALISLEKRIYQHARSLVALSPGIEAHIREIVPEKKIDMIPNFADLQVFHPLDKSERLLQQYGLSDAMTVAYAGALGEVNALEELLHFAAYAREHQKAWQFLIMGTGSKANKLEQLVHQQAISNVHFIPFGPKHKVNEVLSLADFAWISFAALPVLKTNSPNKFFDALAAGKPVLVNQKGWVYDLVKKHNIGVPVLSKELDKALKTLTHLEENPAEIQKMGEKSRKLAEAFFNKEEAIKALLRVFEK